MDNSNTTNRLLLATKELLLSVNNPDKITARQIANHANVNLAMINYCFGSKDKLLKLAIDDIIALEFSQFVIEENASLKAKEKLKLLLYHVSKITIQYESISRISIPYALLNAPIDLPDKILPYIKEHFKGQKEENHCKMLAYDIVSFMQLVFYRANEFYNYCGINLKNTEELQLFIDSQLDLKLGGTTNEK